VDAIWLSPFYRSPQRDFGYDVADHCAVDPLFGTLEDFDRLLTDAHARGIRVIVDWVPNHVSNEHPWFEDARTGKDRPHRDWFVWRDGTPDEPPNNWIAAFPPDSRAWSFDAASDQWFLHLFLPTQPDLDWDNPAVESAMHDVLRFWLDRGVDGFRADVLHAIAKPEGLPDAPPEYEGIPYCALNDIPSVHPRLRKIRAVLDEYGDDRMMIGEVYLLETRQIAPYYGTPEDPELHLSFLMPLMHTPWTAEGFAARMDEVAAELEPRDAWPVWVLSSHDAVRHPTRIDRYLTTWAGAAGAARVDPAATERRARAAAVLLLTQRGTPFLYQGEELGLAEATIPPDQVQDPGGRDGCRAPVPWSEQPGHGWERPWLPLPPDARRRNAASERADPSSTLHFYRRLIALRRATPALREGASTRIDAPDGVLAWRREHPLGDRLVLVNFTGAEVDLPALDGAWCVELDTTAAEGQAAGVTVPSRLGPDQALVLAPR
jgi:alpha-glucosidase